MIASQQVLDDMSAQDFIDCSENHIAVLDAKRIKEIQGGAR